MSAQESLSVSSSEAAELAKSDLDFFGALAMPDDVTLAFPEFYKQLWAIITQVLTKRRDFSKYAIGLPRGHGKTFVVKLLILYVILFTDRKFILIVSSIKDNAQNILADVADMLDSENIMAVFGNWRYECEIDRQDQKKFIFRGRPIILKAAGAGTSIRGIQVKNARPDVILCDDVQTREGAESVQESNGLMKWLVATLLKAKSPTGCTTIYVGNMYPDLEVKRGVWACILRNLQQSKFWTSLIVGGILADGRALWEELQPLDQLIEDYENDLALGCPEVFNAEVLNNPTAGATPFFDRNKVLPFSIPEGALCGGNFVLIDPSGYKSTSDQTAIGYFEVHDGIPVLCQLISEVLTPKETIKRSIEICAQRNCGCIAVESVAYQRTLVFWFNEFLETAGMTQVEVVEVHNGGRPKSARILAMLKGWMKDEVRVVPSLSSICLNQAVAFKPTRTDNIDDILDLLAYAPEIVSQYPHSIAITSLTESFEDWLFSRSISQPTMQHDCLTS